MKGDGVAFFAALLRSRGLELPKQTAWTGAIDQFGRTRCMSLHSKSGTENKITLNQKILNQSIPTPLDPEEGQRLIRAFVRIRSQAVRERIIVLAETAESGAAG